MSRQCIFRSSISVTCSCMVVVIVAFTLATIDYVVIVYLAMFASVADFAVVEGMVCFLAGLLDVSVVFY